MAKKKHNYYFDSFSTMARFSCSAAKNLKKTLTEFERAKLPELMQQLHSIEHNADGEKHAMMKKLAQASRTPIEGGDIVNIAHEIDNVTDAIEDVLLRIYMFNVSEIREDAVDFTNIIIQCCEEMKTIMDEFSNFKKSKTIHDAIIEMNRLEEVGDVLYKEAVHRLYTEEKDAVTILAWTDIFDHLERCCDSCEHVANVAEGVIMKN